MAEGVEFDISPKDRGMMEIKRQSPESPTAIDHFLTNAHDRKESGKGFSPSADLVGFFRSTIDDAIDNDTKKGEITTLKKLQDTAADIAIGKDVDRKSIKAYIDTQKNYWKKRAEMLSGEEQQKAKNNLDIFQSFEEVIDNKNELDKLDFEVPGEKTETREEPVAQTETLADRVEEAPDIDNQLKMTHANEALENIRDSKLKTLKKIVTYFEAHQSDIDAFIQRAGETNPNWVTYLPAIRQAVKYWKTSSREEEDSPLTVTPKSGGEFDVRPYDGAPLQANEEGEPFIIDPHNESDKNILQDSIAFVYYEDVVKTALEAITILNEPAPISPEQQAALGQILGIHSNNLETHDPDRFAQDDPVLDRIGSRINGILLSFE